MALPPYIDKVVLSASQILAGVTQEALRTRLESHRIAVWFDDEATQSAEGGHALDLLVRLLARLWPRLTVAHVLGHDHPLVEELVGLARRINPVVDLEDGVPTLSVVVGRTRPDALPAEAPAFYVGSEGWTARFSPSHPVGSGGTSNPFGAGAAACIAAANVFKAAFGDALGADSDGAVDLSVLDGSRAPSPSPGLSPVDLSGSVLVGLGAIGHGVLWALGHMPGLSGSVDVVDHDALDLSNCQRYVLAEVADVDSPKTDLALRALAGSGLAVTRHPLRWETYVSTRGWGLDRVAVAVDSPEVRVAIQAALPRTLLNAWTGEDDLGVSRHPDLTGPCLACLYLPRGKRPSEAERIARDLGFDNEQVVKAIAAKIYAGAPVDRPFLEAVARQRRYGSVEPLLPFEGQPYRTFYRDYVCGGRMLRLDADAGAEPVDAPMAFQSALAGILLAAELVAEAGGLRASRLPTTTRIDLLAPLAEVLHVPAPKNPSGRCLCVDPDYIGVYESKFAVPL